MEDDGVENFEENLTERTRELLNHQVETDQEEIEAKKPEMRKKLDNMDEKAEKRSTSKVPFTFDPQEIKYLAENRKKMSNEELKQFMEQDSEVSKKLRETDDWESFSRWEERFLIQNFNNQETNELAEQLNREPEHVKLKLRMLGINITDL